MAKPNNLIPLPANQKLMATANFLKAWTRQSLMSRCRSSQTIRHRACAAERGRTAGERNIIDVIQFQDGQGHVEHGNKTVSPEHAADELKAYRERKAAVADQQLGEQLAAAVDEFRGVPEQPEPQPNPDWAPEPQPEYAPAAPTELDHLLQTCPRSAERRSSTPTICIFSKRRRRPRRNIINISHRRRTTRSNTSRALPKAC